MKSATSSVVFRQHLTFSRTWNSLIIIIPGQFIKRRKWWFVPPHQGRFDILTIMGRECSCLDRVTSTTLHLHVQGYYTIEPKGAEGNEPKLSGPRLTHYQ